ncbi:MAG: hypothetical protein R3D62_10685 [Xanthobacteraceae bacterium]
MADKNRRKAPEVPQADPLLARRASSRWVTLISLALLAAVAVVIYVLAQGLDLTGNGQANRPSVAGGGMDTQRTQPPMPGVRATGTVGGTENPMMPSRILPTERAEPGNQAPGSAPATTGQSSGTAPPPPSAPK